MNYKDYFLNKYFPGDSFNLSQRITALEFQKTVVESLRIAFAKSIRMQKLVKGLSQYTTKDTLKAPIRGIISAARSAMDGDLSAHADLKKMLNAYPELENNVTGMNKAYDKIVAAADKLSADALEKAVEYAVNKKALANAFRIAVTESHRAYNLGAYSRAVADDDTLAIRLDLSTSVTNCEICTELAERDNGAGPGIYAVDNTPATPIHPHCRCLLTPVFKMDIDPGELEESYDGDVMEAID